jgi:hypothetical protein
MSSKALIETLVTALSNLQRAALLSDYDDSDFSLGDALRGSIEALELVKNYTPDLVWIDARTNKPKSEGYYLVVQDDLTILYQWVRFWDGSSWVDAKEEKYGIITYYTSLPDLP